MRSWSTADPCTFTGGYTHMILSPRLQAIADFIKPCDTMADIGTDHAYLPVWLCLNNRCNSAIAADVNQGPLDRATETVARFHLQEKISLRLGSGADPLTPGEADAIVIAGMGGLLIGELLLANPQVFQEAKQIYLQPMSSIPELRESLYHMGYTIREEILVPEEDKLYHILSVVKKQEAEPFSPADFILGRKLCQTKPVHFPQYIQREKSRLTRKLEGLKAGKNPNPSVLEETEALLREMEQLER